MIVTEQNNLASKYVSKFSTLIRTMLDNSEKPEVTLLQSIDFINKYLEMEKMRFPKLKYSIEISKELNAFDISLPPTIIQPLVENAIVHGYENKGNEAQIDLKIYKDNNLFIIDVVDSGKGLNGNISKKTHTNNAIATKNIQHQIELINQKYGADYTLKIYDRQTLGHGTKGVVSRLTFTNENLIQW